MVNVAQWLTIDMGYCAEQLN